ELENAVERAVVLCRERFITPTQLPAHILEDTPQIMATTSTDQTNVIMIPSQVRPLREALEEPEKRIIEAALRAHNWNRQATADALDINRTTLYKKMKHYGLDAEPAMAGHV
ncbi:MAG: hypothetical protein KDA33_17590, partial [Phycisphaerales bacterium]|nr:hypothetical protein [Phycisphaerales bacterium]